MKIKNRVLLLSVLIFGCLLSACNSDDNDINDKNQLGISFSGTIGEITRTKTIDNQWEATDAIGIYMKQEGEDLTTHILSDAKNIKYVTSSEDGKFEVENTGQAILYPQNGQAVDFIAYHPFQTTIQSYAYKVNVVDQQNQASIDLLYSDNAKNLSKDKSSIVGLAFSHKLTKILINIVPSGGITNLTGVEVVAKRMLTKADFHLGTAILTPEASSAGDIAFKTQAKGSGVLAEAIILPMAGSNNRIVTFTLDGKAYTWTIPSATEFLAGKRYTYNASLSEKEVVIINPNGTIVDWDEVKSGDIEAAFDDAPPRILVNQTNDALNGLDEGESILLKGSITSIVELVSAKIISETIEGVKTEIDLLETTHEPSMLILGFEKSIIATSDLAKIRIEVEDKNQQKASQELKVSVGFYSYNFLASCSGFATFPSFVKPFLSASAGGALGFCDAKALSSSVEVGFSTYTTAFNIVATNMTNANPGKFQHPTCGPAYWDNKTTVHISKAALITRSNFDVVTVSKLKKETTLTSGGTSYNYLTDGATNTIPDVAFIYQASINGENKRVVFCLDRLEDETPSSAVRFWLNMIVEK